ncbi:hypothetical protein TSOC_014505, partial [Tetrabaena socialis]
MLRARHVSCLDTYAQARSRALDMLLALVGLDPSCMPGGPGPGSGGLAAALQSAEQLQRLVGGWATQLRVLLVGAAAELALAQDLFADFEEGVGSRGGPGGAASDAASKLTMLDGTVHPICATTLSFLKRLFTHSNALTLLFAPNGGGPSSGDAADAAASAAAAASSAIMRMLMRLIEVGLSWYIEALEAKARSYKAAALGHLFLMNNVHYMVWTVEQAAAADKQLQRRAQAAAEAALAAAAAESEAGATRRAKRHAAAAAAAAAAEDGSDADAGAAAAAAAADLDAAAAAANGLGVLGLAWVERHKDIVEHYGAAYHEATWQPLIAVLEGVLVN